PIRVCVISNANQVNIGEPTIHEMKWLFSCSDMFNAAFAGVLRHLFLHLVTTENSLFAVSTAITIVIGSSSMENPSISYLYCHSFSLNFDPAIVHSPSRAWITSSVLSPRSR